MSRDPEQPKANNETERSASKYDCWPHIRALMCCCARNLRQLGCWLGRSWTPANLPHFLTAFCTLGLAIFAYYAWTEAVHGTQALQGQLKVLRDEQRPWVSFGVNVTPLSVGTQFKAAVGFANVGHSPAFKMRSQVTPYTVKRGDPEPPSMTAFSPIPAGRLVSTGILLPGPPALASVAWDDEKGASQADLDAVKSGALNLWLLGRVEYHDADGAPHHTMFRGVFDPSANTFVFTGEGNDAD